MPSYAYYHLNYCASGLAFIFTYKCIVELTLNHPCLISLLTVHDLRCSGSEVIQKSK
jgi:hypothetical protein